MFKSLPLQNEKSLLPPNYDYEYFANHLQHPFKHRATEFELVNAWWLAEASLLAYAVPDFARSQFQQAGLTSQYFSDESTQCYLAYNDNLVIVTFRGTEVKRFQDFIADIKKNAQFFPVESDHGGSVHGGLVV